MSINKYLLAGFQSEKAAQIAAFFAVRSKQTIEKLKLIKLIYLSEREFMGKYGQPMLYDELFSLPHGPICSSTLNGINGDIDKGTWEKFISRQQNKITAIKNFARDDFDEISDAEIEILENTWESFGWMTASQIRNYTHKHCSEYTEIKSSRVPIHYTDVFKALGLEDAEFLSNEVDEFRKTEAMIAN